MISWLDYTTQVVALGAGLLGLVAGALGSFAVLRGQALLGDAISHAALPGIVLAFVLTGTRTSLALVLGAAVAGWVGTLLVMWVVRESRVSQDAALGIVLSVFFGFGMVLLTWVQKMPTAAQAGLDSFLFGQAATLMTEDLKVIAGLGGGALLVTFLFWKEFKLLSFDGEFGATLGLPMAALDILLTTVLVVAIVIGLQAVGVVLMSALVVAPAAAARQWTDRLGLMVILAGLIGGVAGVMGALLSGLGRGIPTGPTVVLLVTAAALVSVFLAPARGVLPAWLRARRHRITVEEANERGGSR